MRTNPPVSLKDFLERNDFEGLAKHFQATPKAELFGELDGLGEAERSRAVLAMPEALAREYRTASGADPLGTKSNPDEDAAQFVYNLQHFAQRAHVLSSLVLGKKITPQNAFQDLRKLWAQVEEVGGALRMAPPAPVVPQLGLGERQARKLLEKYGPNQVAVEREIGFAGRLLEAMKNPLVVLLLVLAAVSYATDDIRATIVIGSMAVLSVGLRIYQESKADRSAAKLKAMVHTTATVLRDGKKHEIPLKRLVPGDVVLLSAGDMVPADVQLLSSKDLYVNQAMLTGEALPVEKRAAPEGVVKSSGAGPTLQDPNICFMGTNVESGSGTAVIVATGPRTYFGGVAASLSQARPQTDFDQGVGRFTWLMIRFMMVMAPVVFVINGAVKGDWGEALMFSLAVAVGLTPEMLPMIVTVCLSKGALAMSRHKVIVKRLNSIQNFGAVDVLCTDKTGTLTQDRIILEKYLNVEGQEDDAVLEFAYVNSLHQTGLKSSLDHAVLRRGKERHGQIRPERYEKVDEVPFDFVRRRMSVVVEDHETGKTLLLCKGAVEEIFKCSTACLRGGQTCPLDAGLEDTMRALVHDLNEDGFRVVAVGFKEVDGTRRDFSAADEQGLTLCGYLAFLDPPKESAAKAIAALNHHGVAVKILTGDNDIVTAKICREVGLDFGERIVLGEEVEHLSDTELSSLVERVSVFAKLEPLQKERIVKALRRNGRVVGFLGDGINDAPALRAADVGISVDTAVDIAKESADIILLEKSLMVLEEGVIEGRKVFSNIVKYIRMGASSNYGNMFSVLGASAFLPFLPMQPIQILVNNLLYDFSQASIPTDNVDEEFLAKPRKWAIDEIKRFILYIGPLSSVFDYVTFFVLLSVFHCWDNPTLFQTGWFVESLLSQTFIVHIIRTGKIPFVQSRPSAALLITTLAVAAVGVSLPFSPLAPALGLTPPPGPYWGLLALILLGYAALTQSVKVWLIRRFNLS